MRVLVGVVDQEQLRARRRGRVWGDQRQGVWNVVQWVRCSKATPEGKKHRQRSKTINFVKFYYLMIIFLHCKTSLVATGREAAAIVKF